MSVYVINGMGTKQTNKKQVWVYSYDTTIARHGIFVAPWKAFFVVLLLIVEITIKILKYDTVVYEYNNMTL